jgi:hypothetical protein
MRCFNFRMNKTNFMRASRAFVDIDKFWKLVELIIVEEDGFMCTKPDMCMVSDDAKSEALEIFLISPIACRLLRSEGYDMKRAKLSVTDIRYIRRMSVSVPVLQKTNAS